MPKCRQLRLTKANLALIRERIKRAVVTTKHPPDWLYNEAIRIAWMAGVDDVREVFEDAVADRLKCYGENGRKRNR